FTYDEMNRLKGAALHALTGSTWSASDAYHEDNITYDLNGNIRTLNRTTKDGGDMDILNYGYGEGTDKHSNRLLKVTDTGDNANGFIDGANVDTEYEYDENGNMIVDKNKGITSIEYNHLNLPSKVIKGTEGYIVYTYDATGRKLSQEVFDGSDQLQKRTDYLGEFIYEDDVLAFVNHEEGRIIPDGNEYQYHMMHHLGNVRLTFTTRQESEESLATMEPAYAEEERAQFLYYDEAVKVNSFLFDHTHKVMGGGSASVPVTSVSLTTSGITIKAGESTSLTAIVQPSNATNKEVTWSSSATGVATVDENGVVSGLSAGNSTITVTTADGDFTASLLVTVEPTDNLIVNPEFDQGMTGWTLYDYTGDGNSASVVQNTGMSGANSLQVDITSSNDVGWRLQLAQHLNFLFEQGKTYEISFVAKAESPRTIKTAITGSPSGATWWAPNTINLTTTPQTVGPFQFTVTNSNMENETEFRLNIYMAYGIVSDVWIDKVVIKDISQGGAVAGDEITPDTLRLGDGQSAILSAEVGPANAANQDLFWTSDVSSCATVTPSGSVTAVAPGKTKIRATSEDGGHSDASVIIVKPVGSNLIRNHEFDDGLEGWTFRDWTSAGGNTASVVEAEGFSGGKVAYVDI